MPFHVVNESISGMATVIRRPKNSQVTLVNQGAVDVYFDFNPNRLNTAAPGVVPQGTKLVATTGSIQIDMHENTTIWTRAVSQTTIEVQP
jgi:uncharacterized beta-barrel protein YwiB (DUF1934 family)